MIIHAASITPGHPAPAHLYLGHFLGLRLKVQHRIALFARQALIDPLQSSIIPV
jgi:hypothetical protein